MQSIRNYLLYGIKPKWFFLDGKIFVDTPSGLRLRQEYKDKILAPLISSVILAALLMFVISPQHTQAADVAPDNFSNIPISHSLLPTRPMPVEVPGVVSADTPIRQEIVRQAILEHNKKPRSFDYNVLKYSQGRREAWCADFTSYIYKEAGQPMTNYRTGGWNINGVRNQRDYFESKGKYRKAGSYTPKPGDVAFYMTNGWNHVNIVIGVDGGEMITIGGNELRTVLRDTHRIKYGANGLVGFGLPD